MMSNMSALSNPTLLYKLVNDQLIVGLALITPEGRTHGTPIWIATDGESLFFYSKSTRKKIEYLRNNPTCTIIFQYGRVDGKAILIPKLDTRYNNYFKAYDPRYKEEEGYFEYKKKWDIMVLITPEKIHDFH